MRDKSYALLRIPLWVLILAFLGTHSLKAQNEREVSVPFAIVEQAPRPASCADATGKEAKDCFTEFINTHLRTHFSYPKEAWEKKIQGRVVVVFAIDIEGKITDIRYRGPSPILEEDAAEMIRQIPQLLPGRQRGKAVKVQYSVPVNYRL